MKKAIIFGITGMDGSYLADLLLEKGYKVVGVARRSSTNNRERIKHLDGNPSFNVVEGDITDYASIVNVLKSNDDVDEIYNLAAQSHVGTSFKQPGLTWDVTAKGCMNILQCLVDLDMKDVKFYQASSSEMFGSSYTLDEAGRKRDFDLSTDRGRRVMNTVHEKHMRYQDENTKHLPQSPYAIAKCAAHMAVRLYREAYGIHASCGILFNHEGPRRGENFVTRKITRWIGDFSRWLDLHGFWVDDLKTSEDHIIMPDCRRMSKLRLGNLDAKRDWGHAKDYVRAMHLMTQQEKPDDYVICTGETRSVRDFLDSAFSYMGVKDWERFVVIDPEFYRPAEVDFLLGNCSKAKKVLGWEREYSFNDLVVEMVNNDASKTNEDF